MKKYLVTILIFATTICAMEDNQPKETEEIYLFGPHVRDHLKERVEKITPAKLSTSNSDIRKIFSDVKVVFEKFSPADNKPYCVPYYKVYVPIDKQLARVEKVVLQKRGKDIDLNAVTTPKIPKKFIKNQTNILNIDFPASWTKPIDNPRKKIKKKKNPTNVPEPGPSSTSDEQPLPEKLRLPEPEEEPKVEPAQSKTKELFSSCLLLRFMGGGALVVGIAAGILYYILVYKKKEQSNADQLEEQSSAVGEQLLQQIAA
jgi:hypothetical protein